MIAIYVAGLIIAFGLGFFICALFRVDGQAPRPIFKPIENLVEPPEDLTTSNWVDKTEDNISEEFGKEIMCEVARSNQIAGDMRKIIQTLHDNMSAISAHKIDEGRTKKGYRFFTWRFYFSPPVGYHYAPGFKESEEGKIYGKDWHDILVDPEDLTKNPWVDDGTIVELRDWPIKNIVSEPEDFGDDNERE